METKLYKNSDILEAYIGTPDKFDWYKKAFASYDVNGIEKFSFNWSWWAFLGGPAYLAYRKCYLMAFAVYGAQLFLSLFFSVGIFFSVVLGFLCPWLVYKKYKKTISEIEATENDLSTQIDMARELGGVNTFVRNVLIVLWSIYGVVLFVGLIGMMALL